MIEVPLEEFEEFYKERINEKYYKVKKVAKKLVTDVRSYLVDIKVCMDHFLDAGEDKIEEKSMRSLQFFSDRIKKEIDAIEVPEEIYYDNILDLLNSIKKLFTNMNEVSRKSLPKFHKEVQGEIKELAYLQRKLGKTQGKLDHFLRKKYMRKYNVKEAEDLLKKLPKFFSLKENIENAKKDLDKFEEEFEQKKAELDRLNNKLLEIEKDPLFKELEKQEKKLFKKKIIINDFIGFKKALRKLKFNLEKETLVIPDLDIYYLNKFLKNPIRQLLKEGSDLLQFSALLVHLRRVLEENKINLKAETKEKSIEQINEIFEEKGLQKELDEYRAIQNRIKELKKEIEDKGLADSLEEIKRKISVNTTKLEHIENDLNRKNKDYLRYLASLKNQREEFQNAVEEVLEEPVKITITFSF